MGFTHAKVKHLKICFALFAAAFFLFPLANLPAKTIVNGNTVTFIYAAPEGTRIVYLAGTFNGWNTGATPMRFDPKENVWKVEMELPTGEHQYKFVLNGSEWLTPGDPDATRYSTDGNQNAVIRVGLPDKIVESQTGDGQIFYDVILHEQKSPMLDLLSDGRVAIRLRTNKNDVESSALITKNGRVEMTLYGSDDYFDYYRAAVKLQEGDKYSFEIQDGQKTVKYKENESFVYKKPARSFHTPDWAKNAVFYQIFPNSFFDGNASNNPVNATPWDSGPLYHQGGPRGFDSYFGGDLEGVIQKLDHLKDLGVSAVYFTPIFKAQSTHKYNTGDYMQIDPTFGTEQTFKDLIDQAHKNGIKVVIDGVFNHTGTAFFAFQDVLKNQENSKYKDWYHIKGWPVIKDGKPLNYDAWWGFGELPKLNELNKETKDYILSAVRKWTQMGLDGWRLDVANEVPHPFWKEFRTLVKTINPQGYIVGEIWDNASPWLKGDEFDSVMNYRFRSACLEFFAGFSRNKDDALNESLKQTVDTTSLYWKQKSAEFRTSITAEDFDHQLGQIRIDYPDEAHAVMLNLLDSHDRYRFLMLFEDNIPAYKLAIFFQMTYPGTPCVYYGSEVGMEGGRDPDCRRAMMWDQKDWNMEIYTHYKKMIAMRNKHEALRTGDLSTVYAKNKQYAFVREGKTEKVLVLLNNSAEPSRISVSWKGAMVNFNLNPYEGRIETVSKTVQQ